MINGDGLTVQKGVTVNGIEGGAAQIRLRADEGDDNNDMYRLLVEDGGTGLKIQGYDGSFQTRLTINSSGNAVFTGTCTATTFIGALTGTASGNAVLTGSTNNQLVTVTGANAIQGETKLTFSGALLDFAINNNAQGFRIGATGNHYPIFEFDANRSGSGSNCGQLDFKWDGTGIARIVTLTGSDTTNKDDGHLAFYTSLDGSLTERFKIQNDGKKLISNGRLTMSSAFIDFSGNISTPQTGAAIFRPAADTLAFSINNNERIRIDSSGRLLIKHTATRAISGDNALLQIENPSSGLLSLLRTSNDNGAAWLAIAKSRSSAGTVCQAGDQIGGIAFTPHDGTDLNHHTAEIRSYVDTGIGNDDTPGYLSFHTNPGQSTTNERLRITKDGHVGINSTSPHDISWGNAVDTKFLHIKGAKYGVLSLEGSNQSNTKWSIGAGDGRLYHYQENDGVHVLDFVRSTKDVEVMAGNLVIRAANKGIDFTGGSSVGTAANILDDYEEGTWNQTITNLGDHSKHSDSHANYTKIGNIVTATFFYKWTGRSTNNGAYGVKVSLPISSATLVVTGVGSCASESVCVNDSTRTSFHTSVYSNSSEATFRASGHNVGEVSFNGALSTSASSGYFAGTISYRTT